MTIEELQHLCRVSGLPYTAARMLERHARETGAVRDDSTEVEQAKHYTQAIRLLVEVIAESQHQRKEWTSGKDRAIGTD